MKRSLLISRWMVAVFVALALVGIGSTTLATPTFAAPFTTFVRQVGGNRVTVAIDNGSGRIVTQVANAENGTSQTTTTNADGSSKTIVITSNGSSATCTDPSGNPVLPCPL